MANIYEHSKQLINTYENNNNNSNNNNESYWFAVNKIAKAFQLNI